MNKARNRFPKGWDEKKVRTLMKLYATQSESDAVAEDEAGYHNANITMMAGPTKLVPRVQRMISKQAG